MVLRGDHQRRAEAEDRAAEGGGARAGTPAPEHEEHRGGRAEEAEGQQHGQADDGLASKVTGVSTMAGSGSVLFHMVLMPCG